MTTTHYILQVLCLLTLVGVPFALTKKPISRSLRLVSALCPVTYGVVYYMLTREFNGLLVALIGLWALFFVAMHPNHNKPSDEEDTQP